MEIYTDGSCYPGPGGWAFVAMTEPETVCFGRDFETTNNRMELWAIMKALEFSLRNPELAPTTIYSDSTYCIGLCEKEFRRVKKNLDLTKILWKLIDQMQIKKIEFSFEWVRGHNGNYGNELADYYAGCWIGIE